MGNGNTFNFDYQESRFLQETEILTNTAYQNQYGEVVRYVIPSHKNPDTYVISVGAYCNTPLPTHLYHQKSEMV